MNAVYTKTIWHGLEAYTLSNALYEAVILPDYGANCIVLRDRRTGTQLFREPEGKHALEKSAYVYGLPILFPPNRVKDGTFTFGIKTYSLPINDAPRHSHIHGLFAKMRFEPVADGVFRFEATPRRPYLTFPHAFVFERRYRLDENGLHHEICITNTGKESMPLAIGLHAAYSMEAGDTLHLPVCKQILLTDAFLPTGKIHTDNPLMTALSKGTLETESLSLSDQFSVHPGVWRIHRKSFDFCFEPDPAFRFVMLWNQEGGKGFVCPEPQTCSVNAFKQEIPSEETGADILAAGETRSWRMRYWSENQQVV